MSRPDWRPRAACRKAEPELFFSEGKGTWAIGQEAVAKAVCRSCPVRQACLDEAIDRGEQFGIWGGMNASQRRDEVYRRREKARLALLNQLQHERFAGAGL